nr:MAG TPA: hypothetical protein [Caudoviricetes sp.]
MLLIKPCDMKSDFKNKWKNVVFLLLLGFTIYLCFRNYKLNSYISQLPDSSVIGIPDTIKLKEEFKPQKPFSQLIEPSRILLYDFYRNSNRMTKFPSSDSTVVDSDNSVKVSKKDSLVQFTLDNNKLNISLFNKETDSYSTRMFNLDLGNYKYNCYEGQLTQKKIRRLSLSPYVYGKYRPFNQLFDIGTGLTIKTTNFNYKLGVNAFCYPKYFSGIKADLEFSIQYNF